MSSSKAKSLAPGPTSGAEGLWANVGASSDGSHLMPAAFATRDARRLPKPDLHFAVGPTCGCCLQWGQYCRSTRLAEAGANCRNLADGKLQHQAANHLFARQEIMRIVENVWSAQLFSLSMMPPHCLRDLLTRPLCNSYVFQDLQKPHVEASKVFSIGCGESLRVGCVPTLHLHNRRDADKQCCGDEHSHTPCCVHIHSHGFGWFHQTPNDEDVRHPSTEIAPTSSRCIGGANMNASEYTARDCAERPFPPATRQWKYTRMCANDAGQGLPLQSVKPLVATNLLAGGGHGQINGSMFCEGAKTQRRETACVPKAPWPLLSQAALHVRYAFARPECTPPTRLHTPTPTREPPARFHQNSCERPKLCAKTVAPATPANPPTGFPKARLDEGA